MIQPLDIRPVQSWFSSKVLNNNFFVTFGRKTNSILYLETILNNKANVLAFLSEHVIPHMMMILGIITFNQKG
jgi:glucose-6-phosphate isomerase